MRDEQRIPPSQSHAASGAERRFWGVAVAFLALVVLAAILIAIRGNMVGIDVSATPAMGAIVSGRTRIVLTFPTAMRPESVEGRLAIAPETAAGMGAPISGRWSWEANGARSDRVAQFIPGAPLTPGATYRAMFSHGASATNGRSVAQDLSWRFSVRSAWLLFLRVDPGGKPGSRQLWRAEADGSNLRQITKEPEMVLEFSASPDGSRIAYTTQEDPQHTALWAINADGAGRTRLSPVGDPSNYASPAWSPAGDVIIYVLRGVVPDGMGGTTLGASKLWAVTPDGTALGRIYGRGDEVGFAPVWSPDGTHLAFREQVDAQNNGAVVLSDLSPNPVRVSAGPGNRIAWSPDGTRVAYDETLASAPTTGTGSSRIVIANADGTGSHPLAVMGDAATPDWSPNGAALVFATHVTRADGIPTVDIIAAAIDGTGDARRLLGGDGLTSADPVWSPDGQTIVATRFSAQRGNDRGLWRVGADGTGARLLVPGGESAAWVS